MSLFGFDLLGFVGLILLGLIIILIIQLLFMIIPAVIVALVVWYITGGDLLLTGVAFLIVAFLSVLKKL